MPFKVCHLTTAHSCKDVRIFIKECRSLASSGYEVHLIAPDATESAVEGVLLHGVSDTGSGRIGRMTKTVQAVYHQALAVDADLYQFHDPELLPVGLMLKLRGKKVIFDSHEDVPKQVLAKPYLNPTLLKIISVTFAAFESFACRKLDGVVAATPYIRDKFLKINPNSVDINNFPLLGELDSGQPWSDKEAEICYVGGIASVRGIRELVQACSLLKSSARLNLAGAFSEPAVEAEVKNYPGWSRVNACGFLDRGGVKDVLGRSVAGLVTLHPIINYLDALPIKMFEYMSAGIPVIASNFPLWKEIVEGSNCGLCVDPLNPAAIAEAMDYLVSNPDLARTMGENGRRAVIEKYNWSIEEKKLLAFYQKISEKGK